MTHLMVAIVAYLLLLALVIMFNHGAHRRLIFTLQGHPISGWPFLLP